MNNAGPSDELNVSLFANYLWLLIYKTIVVTFKSGPRLIVYRSTKIILMLSYLFIYFYFTIIILPEYDLH